MNSDIKIIYVENHYGKEGEIKVHSVTSLPDSELLSLLNTLCSEINNRHADLVEQATKSMVSYPNFNLASTKTIKTISDLKMIGNEIITYDYNGLARSLAFDGKLTDWELNDLTRNNHNAKFFVQIETPRNIKSQLDNFKARIVKKKELQARERKKKQIEKAKKLLEKAGVIQENE